MPPRRNPPAPHHLPQFNTNFRNGVTDSTKIFLMSPYVHKQTNKQVEEKETADRNAKSDTITIKRLHTDLLDCFSRCLTLHKKTASTPFLNSAATCFTSNTKQAITQKTQEKRSHSILLKTQVRIHRR